MSGVEGGGQGNVEASRRASLKPLTLARVKDLAEPSLYLWYVDFHLC